MSMVVDVRKPSGKARPQPAPRRDPALRTAPRAVPTKRERLKIVVRGAVQGVGFRPFVYRVAEQLNVAGWVSNTAAGVFIEVEGVRDLLSQFLLRLEAEKPPLAVVQSLESSFIDPVGFTGFEIRESDDRGHKSALILPDIATCADCLREILDPNNRRFQYPFTNCTNCGPRFSIIEALPYDRANTAMKKFAMCEDCDREYHNPHNRRFHAQPNACPKCGPHLELWTENGEAIAARDDALRSAAAAICAGKIVALKGLGGFQLIVDARNEDAVALLRERKRREEKPFAVMYPSLECVRADCDVSQLEERLLLSPEAPIVLLRQNCRESAPLASATGPLALQSVAPGNPNLGVMLPYSPLHHLLMREVRFPIVATSGNLSDEPICVDEREGLQRLHGIADLFLVHNRPIVRHMDDSVVRVMCGREMILRRARGYAPLPIAVKSEIRGPTSETILAVGAHLKNSVALKMGDNIFVSQHIGDLETREAHTAFRRTCADLPRLYDENIEVVTCDLHPDYLSTKYAHERQGAALSRAPSENSAIGKPPLVEALQHHFAHVAACMGENQIEPPALGVAWDGTGYGLDGTIWGGEFLVVNTDGSFERVAHLRQFRLPGGDVAIRQPRRSAIGLLYELFGNQFWNLCSVRCPQRSQPVPGLESELSADDRGLYRSRAQLLADLSNNEQTLLRQMLEKKINAPLTSSIGRLFDAVGSLAGIRQQASFEGQAAMELEFARQPGVSDAYPFGICDARPTKVDWGPMIRALLSDVTRNEPISIISAKFHNALAEMVVAVAKKIGQPKIVLTGGCFQNRYLTERIVERLREENFVPYWHQRIPPNDGGISFGQAVAASWLLQ